nr:MAG TPA: hypothetical protein [Caudoviricetes sp.]
MIRTKADIAGGLTVELLPYTPELLPLSAGQLPGLHQRDLGPSSEAQISNPASVGNAETPTFDPRGVNPKGEAVAIGHGVSLFTRSQGRNFSCREVFRHEAQ